MVQECNIEIQRKDCVRVHQIEIQDKWDKLKVDYGTWKKLTNKHNGIGLDESRTKIIMSEHWWKMMEK